MADAVLKTMFGDQIALESPSAVVFLVGKLVETLLEGFFDDGFAY
jgi:hypothetical protein